MQKLFWTLQLAIGVAAMPVWGQQPESQSQSESSTDTKPVELHASAMQPQNSIARAARTIPDLFQVRTGSTGAVDGSLKLQINPASLEQVRSSAQLVQIALPISLSSALDLELERFEVIAPDARFVRGGKQGSQVMTRPNVILLRGNVRGEPGSRAFIALTERGGGSGSIERISGQNLSIISERLDDDRHGLIVQERGAELPPFDQFCVTIGEADASKDDGGGQVHDWRGPRVLRVAVDSDLSYFNLFQNEAEAQAYIVQVIGAVSDIYMRDLNMKLVLGFSRIWPEGGEPFEASDLFAFRDYWLQFEDMTGLNLVHLFSGRRDTSYGGIAFLASGCSNAAFGISAFLNGSFPTPLTHGLWGNWDVIVIAHEMGHNLGTPHTHDYQPPIDQCTSGVEERGTIMSYCHTRSGGLRNIDLHMHTRVAADIADNNPPDNCLWRDCNGNQINDSADILLGSSADTNADGVPDECQDCNGNGVLDPIETLLGSAVDINANLIPDECEEDCNNNAVPDSWELDHSPGLDINGNGIPDSCEPDCDQNGVADFIDIRNGTHTDIDRDRVPDACQDCDNNGVTDWIDLDRQFNLFISQSQGIVREYHAVSAMPVRDWGELIVNGAYDVVFGPDRQLYIASFNDHSIARINIETGVASTFISATLGGLKHPAGLAFGPDGHLYVASQGNAKIFRYHGVTGSFLGQFAAAPAGSLLWDLTFGPNGNLFVINSANNSVLQFHGVTGASLGEFVAAPAGQLNDPRAMVFLPNGHLLVTNRGGNRITRYSAAGTLIGRFNDEYPLNQPWSLALTPSGNVLAARQANNDVRVVEYNSITGRYIRSFVRGDLNLATPTAIAIAPASPDDLNGDGIPDVCQLPTCPADIQPTGGDGVVNVNDLLAVINGWGACTAPCPPYCPADITRDCSVNINDLLSVINGWGPCP